MMGLKSWIAGKFVTGLLRNWNVPKGKRQPVSEAVKNMMNAKKEPVAWHGAIAVVVALAGAFGLDLTAEQLSITISTIITIGSFLVRRKVSPVS
tara:strand:- start:13626 stop:13907 length:282 start_codon:yes stop_codon:yes gene_type:complete